VSEVRADLPRTPQMPRYVRHQDRSQMRLLGQKVPVPYARIGIVFDEQFPDHDDGEEIGGKAMNPEARRAGADVGHGEAQEIGKEEGVDVSFEIVGLGPASSGEVER